MAWVLIDDNLPNHPKVARANSVAPLSGWLYVCGLAYCRRYHTGGAIPRSVLATLGAGANPRRAIDALVTEELWDLSEGGWQVHDSGAIYADETDKANKQAQTLAATEDYKKRSAAARKGWEARATVIEPDRLNKHTSGSHTHPAYAGVGDGVGTSDLVLKKKKCEADFTAFWAAYPRKDGKQKAFAAWLKLAPDDDTQRQIAADIDRRRRSTQWMKDEGQFIPHGSTYLNGRRWEDGFEERPRLAERTINILKGFQDVEDIA
jgi:hypothetical protein